eukprot:9446333-Pyramimonas_sp.AAC.1
MALQPPTVARPPSCGAATASLERGVPTDWGGGDLGSRDGAAPAASTWATTPRERGRSQRGGGEGTRATGP